MQLKAKKRHSVPFYFFAVFFIWTPLFSQDKGKEQKRVLELVRKLKRETEGAKKIATIKKLGQLGPLAKAAIPALIQVFQDRECQVRKTAMEALAKIGPSAVPALLQALKESHWRIRSYAALTLGCIRPRSKNVVSALLQALKDRECCVRESAAWALGQIGPQTKSVVPALVKALSDRESSVRETAAEALGCIGPKAKDAVPALVKALGDGEWQVRKAASEALVKIGPFAIPALQQALSHPKTQWVALKTLYYLRGHLTKKEQQLLLGGKTLDQIPKDLVPLLYQMLVDPICLASGECQPNNLLLHQMLGAPLSNWHEEIAQKGEAVKNVMPALLLALQSNCSSARKLAAETLGRLDPQVARMAIPALTQALKDREQKVRLAAAYALLCLSKTPHRKAQETFLKALQDPDDHVLELLEKLREKARFALPVLKKWRKIENPELEKNQDLLQRLGKKSPKRDPLISPKCLSLKKIPEKTLDKREKRNII